jgi:hypothetical protein
MDMRKVILIILLLIGGICEAQTPQHFLLMGPAAVDTVWATLSPTNKSSNITLSGGNLTFTGNTIVGRGIATVGNSSGLKYAEYTSTSTNTGNEKFGIGTAIPTAADATRVGLAVPNVSYRLSACITYCVLYNLGAGYFTSGAGGSCPTTVNCPVASGTTVGIALNMVTNTAYIIVNSAIVSTITGIPAGTWYITVGSDGQSGSGTVNFGASPWVYNISSLGLTGYTGYY